MYNLVPCGYWGYLIGQHSSRMPPSWFHTTIKGGTLNILTLPESHSPTQEKWQLKDDKTLRGKEHEGYGQA